MESMGSAEPTLGNAGLNYSQCKKDYSLVSNLSKGLHKAMIIVFVFLYLFLFHRSSLRYPEIAIGGLGVTKIGKSSVISKIGFFKPKQLCGVDPIKESGLSLLGSFADDINLPAIQESYVNEAVALVHIVQVCVDPITEKPVAGLPEVAVESLKKILVG